MRVTCMDATTMSPREVTTTLESERTVLPLPEAFPAFYAREFKSVVGLGYVLTGSHWAAEDLAQQAFTEAHQRWSKVSGYDDPGAWVRRVMVNKSTSRFRKLKSETKALTRLSGRREEHISLRPRSNEVWAAVRKLPTRQAQAIALLYWDDYSIAQIAEVLECGTETVKTHLKRGRATLATKLAELQTDLT